MKLLFKNITGSLLRTLGFQSLMILLMSVSPGNTQGSKIDWKL